ncbi:MAG: ABC transporter substrate-binding protein [Armatimonadota bacterium]|nr:ABC transporter substrate-binding protein [Armatimonadota bacterium]MDR7438909.1 ABC transporter substrate-binding protein [Armatimonadota bacterium]MDR7562449.1 ABC transporter substrate-binding protein [Armatimonadota bacterium]MDR7601162.1 ABC transporter substrate-binding protein [Armatimonadota bacterium]
MRDVRSAAWRGMWLVGLILVLVVAAGGLGEGAPPMAPKRGGVLRVADAIPNTPFLPWEMSTVSMPSVMPALEPLVWVDRLGRVHPGLAERWEISQDLSAITLFLRQGVRFHDGTAFNAEAVQWNLERQIQAKRLPWVRAVRAVDQHRVRLELAEWDNRILSALSGPEGLVVSPASVERGGVEGARWNPVGTGPFRLVRFERGVGMRYRRFEGYWQRGKPYLDEIEYVFIQDLQTMRAGFLAGRLDVINVGPIPDIGYSLVQMGYPSITGRVAPNLLIPDSANATSPFADRRVRVATWLALDREAIARALGYGRYRAEYQLAAFPSREYDPSVQGPKHNPDQARRLLEEAGYPQGFRTELIYPTGRMPDVMSAIQHQLGQVGILVELRPLSPGGYVERIQRGWNGLLAYALVYQADLIDTLGTHFFGPFAFASWKRPAGLEQAYHEARKTRTPEVVKMRRINRLLLREADLIPVVHSGAMYVLQRYVRDTFHLQWKGLLWRPADAWLDR